MGKNVRKWGNNYLFEMKISNRDAAFIIFCLCVIASWFLPSGAKAQSGYNLGLNIFSQETSGRQIQEVATSGDTIFITVHDWGYQAGWGPNYGCLVNGCTSDHKWHEYTRLVFIIKPAEEKFLRREIQVDETKTVTTEQTVKRWVEKSKK